MASLLAIPVTAGATVPSGAITGAGTIGTGGGLGKI